MKLKKRVFSALMILAMLLSSLSVYAAEGDEQPPENSESTTQSPENDNQTSEDDNTVGDDTTEDDTSGDDNNQSSEEDKQPEEDDDIITEELEVIFEDITQQSTDVAEGEAKIMVSIKGLPENTYTIQIKNLEFNGELKYKSILFLTGENNPDNGSAVMYPTVSSTNRDKNIETFIVSVKDPLEVSDVTDLFILTFENEAGGSVELTLGEEENYILVESAIEGTQIPLPKGASIKATASEKANEGKKAEIKIDMDALAGFNVSKSSETIATRIEITITGEDDSNKNYKNLTILGNEHALSGTTYLIENVVLDGEGTYSVEIKGIGYVTFYKEGVDFNEVLEVTNSDFIPGDVDGNGKVEEKDIDEFNEAKEKYDEDKIANPSCDFNRDGKIDKYDFAVFDNQTVVKVPGKITTLSANSITTSSFTVSWEAPDNGGADITEYSIMYGTNETSLTNEAKVTDLTKLEYTLTGLSSSTTYYFCIAAKNEKGIGEYSETKSAKTSTGGGGGGGGGAVAQPTTYTVTFDAGEGKIQSGSATVKVEKNAKLQNVPTVKAPEGKEFVGWTKGNDTIDPKTVKVTANITFKAVYKDIEVTEKCGICGETGHKDDACPKKSDKEPETITEFTDLTNHMWAADAIYTLKQKGIISGTSETTYSPANNIKRGDFMLILVRMLGLNAEFTENFDDVPSDSYYANAIGIAKAIGIASGYENKFRPEDTITRQDLITLAYRAFLSKGFISETAETTPLDIFADKADITPYAVPAMSSMVKAGIIAGSDGKVNPLNNATRAEVAVMCARLLGLMK